ncbi:MAG: tetratricopeptide repeat protein [Bacteroidales bacterium]
MRKSFYLLTVLLGLLLACASPEKMKEQADQIKAKCTPAVLEAKAGVVRAKIDVSFPEKFFHPNAILEVQPVLKYEGKEELLPIKMLQGEKVKENHTVITQRGGGYSQDVSFNYTDKMRSATLELRVTLIVKGQRFPYPSDIKIADGTLATYTLANVVPVPVWMGNEYQKTIMDSLDAEIKFLINQANIRPAELKKESFNVLESFLLDAARDSSKTVKHLQILSYASPDGSYELNEKLSDNRAKSSISALGARFKKSKLPFDKNAVAMKHTAEDWEGFQALMRASNIRDKELILRILSMYSDSEVREREIKNIASIYTVVADKILPELRRSKFLVAVEKANLNDEQLKAIIEAGAMDSLDVEQLMYSANLYVENSTTLEAIYKMVANKFGDVRGYNNLGTLYLLQNELEEAKIALDSAMAIDPESKEVKNNMGYLLLKLGKIEDGEKQLVASGLEESKEGLAYIAITKGRYEQAVLLTKGSNSVLEGLALLLYEKVSDAKIILEQLPTAQAFYLRAIAGARLNIDVDVLDNLKKAINLDPASYKELATKDAELAAFRDKISQ